MMVMFGSLLEDKEEEGEPKRGGVDNNFPVKAITVDSGVGCASGLINEWLREHKLRGWGGACRS